MALNDPPLGMSSAVDVTVIPYQEGHTHPPEASLDPIAFYADRPETYSADPIAFHDWWYGIGVTLDTIRAAA